MRAALQHIKLWISKGKKGRKRESGNGERGGERSSCDRSEEESQETREREREKGFGGGTAPVVPFIFWVSGKGRVSNLCERPNWTPRNWARSETWSDQFG